MELELPEPMEPDEEEPEPEDWSLCGIEELLLELLGVLLVLELLGVLCELLLELLGVLWSLADEPVDDCDEGLEPVCANVSVEANTSADIRVICFFIVFLLLGLKTADHDSRWPSSEHAIKRFG